MVQGGGEEEGMKRWRMEDLEALQAMRGEVGHSRREKRRNWCAVRLWSSKSRDVPRRGRVMRDLSSSSCISPAV